MRMKEGWAGVERRFFSIEKNGRRKLGVEEEKIPLEKETGC